MSEKLKVLIAKCGLDGHDLGAKFIARLLMDAGVEVVYTGLRQSAEQVAVAAIQEDVHMIGLSSYAGNHKETSARLIRNLRERDSSIPVIIGGLIPRIDIEELKKIGVVEVFPEDIPPREIVGFIDQFRRESGISLE